MKNNKSKVKKSWVKILCALQHDKIVVRIFERVLSSKYSGAICSVMPFLPTKTNTYLTKINAFVKKYSDKYWNRDRISFT